MLAYLPPLAFVIAWALAVIGWEPLGAGEATPFDERALSDLGVPISLFALLIATNAI